MAVFGTSIDVAIALLLGIAFLKYSGYMDSLKKEVGYLASGAVFLLLSAVVSAIISTPTISSIPAIGYVELIFVVIAFILVLIGAIAIAIQIFAKLR